MTSESSCHLKSVRHAGRNSGVAAEESGQRSLTAGVDKSSVILGGLKIAYLAEIGPGSATRLHGSEEPGSYIPLKTLARLSATSDPVLTWIRNFLSASACGYISLDR
jgi:hypothetical protein